jgi:hypothetical protein
MDIFDILNGECEIALFGGARSDLDKEAVRVKRLQKLNSKLRLEWKVLEPNNGKYLGLDKEENESALRGTQAWAMTLEGTDSRI